MNKKLMVLYLNDVQVISPTRITRSFKWVDRSIGFMFGISLLALLVKIGAEELASMVLR